MGETRLDEDNHAPEKKKAAAIRRNTAEAEGQANAYQLRRWLKQFESEESLTATGCASCFRWGRRGRLLNAGAGVAIFATRAACRRGIRLGATAAFAQPRIAAAARFLWNGVPGGGAYRRPAEPGQEIETNQE